jgi:hypothetical protein
MIVVHILGWIFVDVLTACLVCAVLIVAKGD